MAKFDYIRAASLQQAIDLINDPAYHNRLLAGGTDVAVLVHYQQVDFNRVVDISSVKELKHIERRGNEILLGAGVTFTEALESELLAETAPLLVEACQMIGSPQIRNLGTLGGNVANAAACADSLPALVCLEAAAHLKGKDGEREIAVSELVAGRNRTRILPGEILTHFVFEVPLEGVRAKFLKLGRRNAQAISRLSMAAMGRVDSGGRIDFVRLTPGAATPQTRRFSQVEGALLGKLFSPELVRSAAELAPDEMIAITGWRWSTEYKSKVIAVLAERALLSVLQPAG
jgi:CO/xanthine dehydrogenase FAD-binding subunit